MPTSPTETAGIQPRRAVPGQAQLAAAPPSGAPGTVIAQQGRATLVAPPAPAGGIRVSVMGREVGRFMGEEMTYVPTGGIQTPAAGPTAYQQQVEADRPTIEAWHRQQAAEIQQKAAAVAAGAPPIQPPTGAGITLVPPPEPPGGIPIRAGGREVGRLVGEERAFVPIAPVAPAVTTRPERPEREVRELREMRQVAAQTTSSLRGWREQIDKVVDTGKKFLEQLKGWTGEGREAVAGEPRSMLQAKLRQEFAESRRMFAERGFRDPYAGAAEEISRMALEGREAEGVRPITRQPTLRGFIAQQVAGIQQQAPFGGMARRAMSGMGLMMMARMGRYFMQPVTQAMTGVSEYEQGLMGAAYGAGLPMGAPGGIAGMMLQRQAQQAQFQLQMGRAGAAAWGWMPQAGGESLAALQAIGRPALGVGIGAAFLGAGAPIALGLGLGVAGIGSIAYASQAAQDREAQALGAVGYGQALSQPSLRGQITNAAQWAWQNPRALAGTVWQGIRAGEIRGPMDFLGAGLAIQQRLSPELMAYGAQLQAGNLGELSPAGQLASMQYFVENRMTGLETMTPQQRQALLSGYMGMTGVTNLGQVNQQLLTQAGLRAQMLGIEPGQAFQPFTQLAGQMGFGPTAGMGLQLAQQAPWGNERQLQQYLWQWGNVTPMMQQAQGMFGTQNLAAWQQLAEMGPGPAQRQMQMLLGGNRQLWSDLGRRIGREDLVTMEAGGLPIYTTEMRGLEDQQRATQRQYRDWQLEQQAYQQQASEQYTRAGWTIQDQQRQLQAAQAQWQFGYQERGFALAGTQWQEQFALQGRQAQESMALGRQMFEARVGFQQQDYAQQQARAAQQYEWRMEDWAYGESRSQLQYGWQMEDLSQAIRYSSGRQRKQLMQQQERATVMESMRREHSEEDRERMEEQREWQEEDFQKSKERNEELIALQREQFEMQKRHWEEDREITLRHHEEDRTLQEERMVKNREFYDLDKQLSDEQIKLQRNHAEEQMKWQREATEKAREQNKETDKLQDAYTDLQRQQADVIANFQRMLTYTEELRGAFQAALGGETAEEVQTRHEAARGHQAGGFISRTERAMLHEGEFVVPAGGQLVLKESEKGLELWQEMVKLLNVIATAAAHGKSSVVVVETNNAKMAQDHTLSLSDEGWAVMPGAM